jgi:hypothetical protein
VAWLDFDRHNFQLIMHPLHERVVKFTPDAVRAIKFTRPEPGLPGGPSILDCDIRERQSIEVSLRFAIHVTQLQVRSPPNSDPQLDRLVPITSLLLHRFIARNTCQDQLGT